MRPYYPDLEDEFAEVDALLEAWYKYQPDSFLVALEMSARCLDNTLHPLAIRIDRHMRELIRASKS